MRRNAWLVLVALLVLGCRGTAATEDTRPVPPVDEDGEMEPASVETKEPAPTDPSAALANCQSILKVEPDNEDALVVCALTSCELEQLEPARDYVSRLKPSLQEYARKICREDGVDLERGTPEGEATLAEMHALADAMVAKAKQLCACADGQCAEAKQQELNALFEEGERQWGDADPPQEIMGKVIAGMQTSTECIQDLMP